MLFLCYTIINEYYTANAERERNECDCGGGGGGGLATQCYMGVLRQDKIDCHHEI